MSTLATKTTASSILAFHLLKPTYYPRQCQYAPSNPNRFPFLQISTSSFPHRNLKTCPTLQSPLRAAFADAQILQDVGATALVLGGAYSLVSTFDTLTQRNIITQSLSRKLVHVMSGLLFMASWPLFSTSTEARYFASFVPLTNCIRLVVHGLQLASNEGLIKSLTREGKPQELLKGPLYYVLVLVFCSLVFWRESPVGVICLAMMCGGDGVADIMGRNFGYVKLPYNQNKSWVGSISMFAFGFLISLGMLYYFSALGYFQLNWSLTAQRVALVSCIATVVESLPTTQLIDDNISVPLVAMVAAYLCF